MEARAGRNGLRIAGLTGIRIGGNVITPPETGSPEVLSVTSPIVLSVKGSKKLICLVNGSSESSSNTAYDTELIYTTTSKTNAPKNILVLRINFFPLHQLIITLPAVLIIVPAKVKYSRYFPQNNS